MSHKLILIAGASASGKSRYLEYLRSNMALPVFSKDGVKEVLYQGIGMPADSPTAVQQYGAMAYDLLFSIAETLMKSGCDFGLESNFTARSRQSLMPLAEKWGYECMTVLFTAPVEVLHKRFVEREVRGERPEAFGLGLYHDLEDFRKNCAGSLDFSLGEVLRVDTSDFEKVDYEDITERIRRFIF